MNKWTSERWTKCLWSIVYGIWFRDEAGLEALHRILYWRIILCSNTLLPYQFLLRYFLLPKKCRRFSQPLSLTPRLLMVEELLHSLFLFPPFFCTPFPFSPFVFNAIFLLRYFLFAFSFPPFVLIQKVGPKNQGCGKMAKNYFSSLNPPNADACGLHPDCKRQDSPAFAGSNNVGFLSLATRSERRLLP